MASAGERMAIGRPSSATLARAGVRDAEKRLAELRAPGSDEPVEAEDLAAAQLEGNVVELRRMRVSGHFQNRVADGHIDLRERRARRSGRPSCGTISSWPVSASSPEPIERAVAEDREAFGDLVDLLELVADEQDRLALRSSAAR